MSIRRAVAAFTGAATVFGAMVLTAPGAQAAPTLPSGFVLVDTPSGQSAGDLTDFAYLPDGEMLTTGRKGAVHRVPPGGQPVKIADIPVYSITEDTGGLTAIGVAPDYATSRTIYTTQLVSPSIFVRLARLSKWRVTGTSEPTGLADESVLLEFQIPFHAFPRGIQDFAVDLGGTLWVAINDHARVVQPDTATPSNVDRYALNALDPAQPTGKLLLVDSFGRGIRGNPYFEPSAPASWRSRTYVTGLRDPRVTRDPRGGVIVLDTGWTNRDEVNIVLPGRNMSWPCWDGTQRSPGYRDLPHCANVPNTAPMQEITRTSASTLAGGIPYTAKSYPHLEYRGAHFIADRTAHKLSTLRYDPAGKVTDQPTDFATDIGDPVSVTTGPNGDIVFADAATGLIRRVSYKPANKAPMPRFEATVDPDSRTARFDAGATVDLDHDVVDYRWDFGDGTSGNGRTVTHTYVSTEPVSVNLTTTDVHGDSRTTTRKIVPSEAVPELTLTAASPDRTYAVNETVSLAASAVDKVDGPLQTTWLAERFRCMQGRACETIEMRTGTGPEFHITFPNETDAHVVITAAAHNNRGVAVSKRYTARQLLARFAAVSSHMVQFSIGDNYEDALRYVTVGATVRVHAPEKALDGESTFTHWHDTFNNFPTRDVRVHAAGTMVQAVYTSPAVGQHG